MSGLDRLRATGLVDLESEAGLAIKADDIFGNGRESAECVSALGVRELDAVTESLMQSIPRCNLVVSANRSAATSVGQTNLGVSEQGNLLALDLLFRQGQNLVLVLEEDDTLGACLLYTSDAADEMD